ncbi:S-layer homology domain-containing protein [Paenibacillus yanchengensis]|uniref:S-layer homology domain-containing protein n=1 Tax=Paenibacillus yanchengensis TaxID=2035833 RepID=A0ABW4YQT3_9BACL
MMMKIGQRTTCTVLLFAILLTTMFHALPSTALAAEANEKATAARIEVTSKQVQQGKATTVDITLHNPQSLKSIEFEVNYNKNAFKLSNDEVQIGSGLKDWLAEFNVDQSTGKVKLAAVNLAGFTTNNAVTLLRLTFQATGEQGRYPLQLANVTGYVDMNESLPIASKSGELTISSSEPIITYPPYPGPSVTPTGPVIEDGVLILVPEVSDAGKAHLKVDQQLLQQFLSDKEVKAANQISIKAAEQAGVQEMTLTLEEDITAQLAATNKNIVVTTQLGSLDIPTAVLQQYAKQKLSFVWLKKEGTNELPIRELMITANDQPVTSLAQPLYYHIPILADQKILSSLIVYKGTEATKQIVPMAISTAEEIMIRVTESALYSVAVNEQNFADITNHWGKTAIDFVASRELFEGMSEEKFAPEVAMTRGMLVTVLGRLQGIELAELDVKVPFNDVASHKYYAPYVAWAYNNKLVQGLNQQTFAPEEFISREQLAVILFNYMKFIKLQPKNNDSVVAFADQQQIASWAQEAVLQMKASDIVKGKSGNKFDGKGQATRAEVAQMIANFIHYAVKQ